MAIEEEALDLDAFEVEEESYDEPTTIPYWVRGVLVSFTVPWLIVFGVAMRLDPYEGGDARRMGTHMQLGLPDCNFKRLAGVPCPSCGMTTSFALLFKADLVNSIKANFAGTGLAIFGLIFVPWAFVSAFFGRFVLVRSVEVLVFKLALVFLAVLFLRWMVVILLELTT